MLIFIRTKGDGSYGYWKTTALTLDVWNSMMAAQRVSFMETNPVSSGEWLSVDAVGNIPNLGQIYLGVFDNLRMHYARMAKIEVEKPKIKTHIYNRTAPKDVEIAYV